MNMSTWDTLMFKLVGEKAFLCQITSQIHKKNVTTMMNSPSRRATRHTAVLDFAFPRTIFFNDELVANGDSYSDDVSEDSQGPLVGNEHHQWLIERQKCTGVSATVLPARWTHCKVLLVTFFCRLDADVVETENKKEVYLLIPHGWRTRTFLLLLARTLSEAGTGVISVVTTMYGTDVCQILANTSPDNPVDTVDLVDGSIYESMVSGGSI